MARLLAVLSVSALAWTACHSGLASHDRVVSAAHSLDARYDLWRKEKPRKVTYLFLEQGQLPDDVTTLGYTLAVVDPVKTILLKEQSDQVSVGFAVIKDTHAPTQGLESICIYGQRWEFGDTSDDRVRSVTVTKTASCTGE